MTQFLLDLYYRHWKKWGWFGDYPNWQAAERDCEGYDSAEIFEKVRQAVLKVKNGEAAFERDSVLFYESEENAFLTKYWQKALDTEGSLRVLDFGGSLGSTYFQHRQWLEKVPNLVWVVVEQGAFVSIGKRDFEDQTLKFEYTVDEAVARYQPNFLLFSSVLQYIERPYALMDGIFKHHFPYCLVERTPFIPTEKDRLTKQIVPEKIYKASYPCWFFAETIFEKYMAAHFQLLEKHAALDKNNVLNCTYKALAYKHL